MDTISPAIQSAQLQTLVATVRSLKATLARLNIVEHPRAWDLTQEALEANTLELRKRLVRPLPAGARVVFLADGRKAEVFNHGAGISFAVRRVNGSTEVCRNHQHDTHATRQFATVVLADLGITY